MLKKLQGWHIVCLGLLPALYVVLIVNSELHDFWRRFIDVAVYITGGVWAAFLLVQTVIHGKKEEASANIFKFYRRQLNKGYFLILSNIVLTLLVIGLILQLLMFRQVEFFTNKDLYLYLNDAPGDNNRIGLIKNNDPIKFRLPVGNRHLVFRLPADDSLVSSDLLYVGPIWSHWKSIIFKKEFEERRYEETLN